MLQEKVSFKYFRMIPKSWRQYVKEEMEDDFRTYRKDGVRISKRIPKMPVRNRIVKQPFLYKRGQGFSDKKFTWSLSDVPPAATGGLTECYLELYDPDTKFSVVFIGRVKCSEKDIFCYATGRALALEAAQKLCAEWKKDSAESIRNN